MGTRHLIVGAGPAGLAALETLRALDSGAELRLVCDEPPYARMVLPYWMQGRIEEAAVRTGDAAWFESLGVETHFGARVARVDVEARRVELEDGEGLDFDRLLVATGSRVAVPPLAGVETPGVLPLWTLEHARAFLEAPVGHTVIVGAGFIAFTVLDAVASRSEWVTFVEREERVLPRMLDPLGSAALRAHLESRGVEVRTGARLEHIEPVSGRCRLHLAGGERLDADAVILATGVRPNVELLEGTGLGGADAVPVDARMRTRAPAVFAAGDLAAGPDLLGGPDRVQAIQPTAVDHGRVAAANMAGHDVAYAGSLTMNILAAQGLEACSFGRWEEAADVTVLENPAGGIYRKYVWDGDRLAGAILVGPTDTVSGTNDAGMLKGLVQTGVRLGPWKDHLRGNPLDLRRAFVASGAAPRLLESTLLAGRAATGGGFRWPRVSARRRPSPHHQVLVSGAPAPSPPSAP